MPPLFAAYTGILSILSKKNSIFLDFFNFTLDFSHIIRYNKLRCR